jgi:phospho-N-acetylmuramoyl-pentapeptide-transferase
MLVLAKAVLALMIGFIMTVSFGLVAIPMLKKLKVRQRVSIFLSDKHSKKEGTPTMGGIIFIIPTLITSLILLFMDKIEFSDNLLIVMFVFVSYAALGFIDDYLIIKRKSNNGLTEMQKLFGQLFIAVVFFFIFTRSGLDPVLEIHTLGIRLDMGWFYGVFILFVLIGSSNAVNLTDGLDGLAGGLSAIAFLAFGMISWGAFWTQGNTDIAIFSFILAGSLLGFLFYNTHPAKVFMGDTGSLALGGTLAAIAILTKYEVTLVIIAGVFVIETLSSIVQMISVKYFNKKIFLMAPLHHHFEKLGWEERDIVKTFWVVGLILAMMGIMFAVWI